MMVDEDVKKEEKPEGEPPTFEAAEVAEAADAVADILGATKKRLEEEKKTMDELSKEKPEPEESSEAQEGAKGAAREMTLEEYMSLVPGGHRARQEYVLYQDELVAAISVSKDNLKLVDKANETIKKLKVENERLTNSIATDMGLKITNNSGETTITAIGAENDQKTRPEAEAETLVKSVEKEEKLEGEPHLKDLANVFTMADFTKWAQLAAKRIKEVEKGVKLAFDRISINEEVDIEKEAKGIQEGTTMSWEMARKLANQERRARLFRVARLKRDNFAPVKEEEKKDDDEEEAEEGAIRPIPLTEEQKGEQARIRDDEEEEDEAVSLLHDIDQLREGTDMTEEMARGIAEYYREADKAREEALGPEGGGIRLTNEEWKRKMTRRDGEWDRKKDRIRKEALEQEEGRHNQPLLVIEKGRTRLCFYKYEVAPGEFVIVPIRVHSNDTITIGYEQNVNSEPIPTNVFVKALNGVLLSQSCLIPVL